MASAVEGKISEGINNALESVVSSREEHYSKNPLPSVGDVKGLISSYGYKNAAISGGAGLIPGPWGMAAAVPEIIAIVRNQMAMVADIAKAHGKTASNELILDILFGASGNVATGLVVVHGQKILVKRAGARVIQKIVAMLGGKITQQLAKSMVAKWLPVAGAAAMATWSKISTDKIGKKADFIFSKQIEYETATDELAQIDDGVTQMQLAAEDLKSAYQDLAQSANIVKTKIQILINLMKIDGKIEDSEMAHLQDFIESAPLSNQDQMQLIEQLGSKEKVIVDYSVFKENFDESLALVIDMIALANVDGNFHVTERMFIKNVAKTIGFDENDLNELLENGIK
ncbi:TerB family tellurite resistance protein [Campylobacter showae]|uniref:TerB family tellurite resistance protein n=1 Tax=Campylobacter showae TaxID=204 RepID=UPI000F098349|nr:TerB family tellurite resistance protein [Campylobacter showae]